MRWSLAASVSALLVLSTSAAEAQRAPADSIAQDSLVRLPAVEAAVSICGAIAGPRTHSGVPARVSGIDRIQLTSWRPDFVGDAILGEPSASLYDDLGSPFKQTLVMRGFAASPVVGLP